MQKQVVHMGMGWKSPAVARHTKGTASATHSQPVKVVEQSKEQPKVHMGMGWQSPSVRKHLK